MEQHNYNSVTKPYRSASLELAAAALNVDPLFCRYFATETGVYALSRWRYFVGSYTLPPMPSPYLVAHLGGRPICLVSANQDLLDTDHSIPGNLFTIAGHEASTWMINGEVDVFVLSAAAPCDDELPQAGSPLWQLPLFRSHHLGVNDHLTSCLMRQLLNHMESGEHTAEAYVVALLEMLELHLTHANLCMASKSLALPSESSTARRINAAIQYLCENLGAELNIQTLSTVAGINPLYFSELFKQHHGVTPQRFILQKRIDRARELLAATDLPIAVISQETGFSSQGHLTTTFSRLMEMTPSEFRKRIACSGNVKTIGVQG